jgi:signal peptidase II
MGLKGRIVRLAWVAVPLVVLDQLAKLAALHWLSFGRPVTVIPYFFDFNLVYNTGSAFSVFAGWAYARWLFIFISIVAVALAIWLAGGRLGREKAAQIALGLITGGAVGNLIDRIFIGRVVDFIDWHAAGLHWPVFNLADAGITVGAVYLGWLILRGRA